MEKNCVVYRISNFIGKKWTLPIILELSKTNGKKRYNELKKGLFGITPKILSTRLKELVKEGILLKKGDRTSFPLHCEYHLTKAGEEFLEVIESLKQWALKNKIKNKECQDTVCRECLR